MIFVFIVLPFGIFDSSLLEKVQHLFLIFEICYIVIFSAIQCGERLGANCKEDYLIIDSARDGTRDSGQQQLQDICKSFQRSVGGTYLRRQEESVEPGSRNGSGTIAYFYFVCRRHGQFHLTYACNGYCHWGDINK